MRQINDAEFGEITVRVIPKSSRISIRVAPNGSLRVSAPKFTPKLAIVTLINSSRSEIRKMISEQRTLYDTSQSIGKSHSMLIQTKPTTSSVTTTGTTIFVSTPDESEVEEVVMRTVPELSQAAAISAKAITGQVICCMVGSTPGPDCAP